MRIRNEFCQKKYEKYFGKCAIIQTLPKKIAESTGKLPPTPMDHTEARAVSVTQSLEPPAAKANAPVIKRVMLNDILTICKSGLKTDEKAMKIPSSP